MSLLVQAAPAPQALKPWWHFLLENPLGLAILIIFFAAIITILVQERKRDKCLKFFRDYHVTYLDTKGRILWGDLKVFSAGLSLLFDAPFLTRRGLIKTSAMIYESEMADCIALCRLEGALTEKEKLARRKQIRRSFRPGMIRRLIRGLRNAFNTLRDAFSKALSTLLGTIFKTKPVGGALVGQQSDLEKIGSTLIGVVGNAYEPILEQLIGKPVILLLKSPLLPDAAPTQLPGYLVDYTEEYLAVFNTDQTPLETIELDLAEPVDLSWVKIGREDRHVLITATGKEAVAVDYMIVDAEVTELDVALLPGCSLKIGCAEAAAPELRLHRTHRIDVVCPRKIAGVHFGSEQEYTPRRDIHGVAPEQAAEVGEHNEVRNPYPDHPV
jgi:hypothetical protein